MTARDADPLFPATGLGYTLAAFGADSVHRRTGWMGMALRRADMEIGPAYEPPRSATERQLAEIWQEAIGIDAVGMHDDFFQVCGSSLVAAVIFTKIHKIFGVKLPLSLLVSAPSIALLAPHVDQQKPQG